MKPYVYTWLSIVFLGSFINTLLWILDDYMSGYFDQQHRDSSLYIAVFVIGVILSFLSSFLSIIFIYFIEQVRKTKWNIGLHISIIGLHILGVYFLSDFDKDVVVGFLGYAASGVAGYYHFVFRRKYRVPVEHELIDRE